VLQENSDGVRKFRVISVAEDEGVITVMASLYDEAKFNATDNGTIVGVTQASISGPSVVPAVNGGNIILEVNQ
jgi:predicted phage tail protein